MCGISGIIAAGKGITELSGRIAHMNRAMSHRGPDGEGSYVREGVGMGHVRLAIIDLSEQGLQPLANEDESIQVVVNGEIYNYRELRRSMEQKGHRFRSHSDSEVVVHLYEEYGDACLEHLNGMFALALWDESKRSLLLARDRFGIKPLYYACLPDGIVFASELTAVLASGMVKRDVDSLAMYGYMALGYVPTPLSAIRGVRKMRPAESLVWRDGKFLCQQYWSPVRVDVPSRFCDAAEQLHALLADSVSAHLIADVPVASFLSGGVDSSLIAALAGKESRVTTICGTFPGSDVDESEIARVVAHHLGTDHREVAVGVDPAQLFSEVASFLDEPFADSSAMPTFAVCRAGRKVAKVMLSGDGGDEVFGGYTGRYRVAAMKSAVPAPAVMAGILRLLPPWRSGRRTSLPAMLDLASFDEIERYVEERQITTLAQRREMFTPEQVAEGESLLRSLVKDALATCSFTHPVHRALWLDISTSLSDDMLTKVDRMSMAHGLEVRVPFLDHRLTEFSLSLPPRWLVSPRAIEGKRILRHITTPLLPQGILERPKQGFVVPLNQWLSNGLRKVWEETDLSVFEGVFDMASMREVWNSKQQHVREDRYALLMFGAWMRRLRGSGL